MQGGSEMQHYTEVSCLPECDERHADDCPREKAEMDYWAAYFGVGTPAFYGFRPADCSCEGKCDPECVRHG